MQIQILSDIHLNKAKYELNFENLITPKAPILILVGDVCNVGVIYYDFFKFVCERFKIVIYVLGNHEYYYSNLNYKDIVKVFKNLGYPNLYVLEKNYINIGDYVIAGCTLFSNPLTWHYIKINSLNNQAIFQKEFNHSVEFIKFIINYCKQNNKKLIMVTHYAPSYLCLDRIDNRSCMYTSSLDHLINKENMEVWIYGHTHLNKEFELNGTYLVSNQRGYNFEEFENFSREKILKFSKD